MDGEGATASTELQTRPVEARKQAGEPDLDLLRVESEHYFQAELGHDQRASWLLGLVCALIAVVLTLLQAGRKQELAAVAEPWLVASLVLLIGSLAVTVWSLWPLAGRNAALWRPWRRLRPVPESAPALASDPDRWRRHYWAHRRRAERKARRLAWAMLLLLAALLLVSVGIFAGLS